MGQVGNGEPVRCENDIARYWPGWFVRLAMAVARFERGHAYDLTVIMPEGDGEPLWIIKGGAKVENAR